VVLQAYVEQPFIETAKFVFERGDDEAHLEAPITEMRVAPNVVAAEAIDALHAFTDDRSAQVSDVHAFGDVRPAVVHYDAALVFDGRSAGLCVIGDELRALGQGVSGDFEVENPGPAMVGGGELGRSIRRDGLRHFLRLPGLRHRSAPFA
jgi:hypothetical protein